MNLGGLGLWEILFILVLAVIIFGPDKLPEVGRTVGHWLRVLRRTSEELTREFTTQLNVEEESQRGEEEQRGDERESGKQ